MKPFKLLLLVLATAAVVVLLATPQVQAGLPNAPATTVIYLPYVLNTYYPPPPVYSPVNKIAYSSGYTSANRVYNIFIMNPDGTGQTQLTNQAGSRYYKPTWSPDGSKIAYYVVTTVGTDIVDQIGVMNANGAGVYNLVNFPGHHIDPTWSPYGNRIAYSSDQFNPGAQTPNDIYVINSDGSGTPVDLTNTLAVHDAWPDWSPDGSKIAYAACTGATTASCQIYVMNADGTGQKNLSNSTRFDYAPNWSPDGKKIVFYRDLGTSTSSSTQIFVMNSDGSGQTQVTFSGHNFYPNWSPDGARIAFQTYYNNYADIYVMNANGSAVTNLTNHQLSYASIMADWR